MSELFQTMEQQRSSYAFERIKKVRDKNDKELEKKVSTIVLKFGTLILTNGLGNTLAFLYSKSKHEHLIVMNMLFGWLLKEEWKDITPQEDQGKKQEKFTKAFDKLVNNVKVEQYMYYTEESLRLINWLRRYAEAMLEKEESKHEG